MEKELIVNTHSKYLQPVENKHYVYLHRDKKLNVILVGKGTNSRYKAKSGRPCKWLDLVNTYQIVKDNLSEEEALNLEKELMVIYKTKYLLNVSKGHKQLPLDLINEYVEYSEKSPTGLIWKKCSTRGTGALTGVVGGVAGSVVIRGKENYDKTCLITINKNKKLAAHRVIWALHYGDKDMNTKVVDHIDGDPLNNKISNLRLVTASVNQKKQKN